MRLDTGIVDALTAAVLFGVSTPIAKLLLGHVPPVALAGLLYLGSGAGLTVWLGLRRLARHPRAAREARLACRDLPWLAGAILAGGVVAPVLLMAGLAVTPAATASLLLNLEGVLTALLAWFVFRENFDRRVATGMAAIAAAGVLLSWAGRLVLGVPWGPLAVAGACLGWAIDNNLTRKVSAADPVQIAALKGVIAGAANLGLAGLGGWAIPGAGPALAAMGAGLLGYGVSLVLFIGGLRHIGAARTGAYFSAAPFIGAAVSLAIFRSAPGALFWVAALLMAVGLWLHLSEHHEHWHRHEEHAHSHPHVHDAHHQHEHDFPWDGAQPHTHPHVHAPLAHSHSHFPDLHHRHRH